MFYYIEDGELLIDEDLMSAMKADIKEKDSNIVDDCITTITLDPVCENLLNNIKKSV
jgi:hypothetical protein